MAPDPSRSTGSTTTVQVIGDLTAIEPIAAPWDALVDPRRSVRAFASPLVFLAWCRLRPAATPRVFTAWHGERLVGVLPLWRTEDDLRLQFPGNLSDGNDVVVVEGPSGQGDVGVARALYEAAHHEGPLLLRCLPEDALLLEVANTQPTGSPRSTAVPQRVGTVQCPHIDLRLGFDAYLATRSSKFRTRLRRFLRKADEHGLQVGELRPDRLAPQTLPQLFLDLHLERIPTSAFTDVENRRHVEQTLPPLFEQGAYRVFAVLRPEAPHSRPVDPGDVLALGVCVRTPRGLGLWNGGFRTEATSFSPGRVLIHAELQAACAEGAEEFDFLRGGERYKEDWCTGRRWLGHWEVD